jgi:predicted Zn-dependent protease
VYGEPASHGVLVDNQFLHPDLDLHIAFPTDGRSRTLGRAWSPAPEAGDAVAVFTIAAESDDPAAVANEVVRKASLEVDGRVESTRIGGLDAARVSARSREGWTHAVSPPRRLDPPGQARVSDRGNDARE